MKKLLITTALATFALSAQAGNFYIQADVGAHKVDNEYYMNNVVEDTVFTQRASIGWDFVGPRIAVDYTNYGKAKDDNRHPGERDVSSKVRSVGVSAFYDFHRFTTVVPYIGVRASHNHNRVIARDVELADGTKVHVERKNNRGGLGVLAGVNFKINQTVNVHLGAEYNRIGNDLYSVGGNLGLRINF